MIRTASITGNSNSTTLWDSVTNTPSLSATGGVVANAVSGRFTTATTAPNTTNAATGVWLFASGAMTGNITVTLQESTVDTAATVSLSAGAVTGIGWWYFKFPTPYVYTTTTANAYRVKVVSTNTNGSWVIDVNNGTQPAYILTDNRQGALATTDDVFIPAGVTVTAIDGMTFGSGTETATTNLMRSIGVSIIAGVLSWDTSASANVTIKGHVYVANGGELRMGTVASPYPSGKVATLTYVNTVDGQYGVHNEQAGLITLVGNPLTNWKAKYVSGLGTAASPLLTDGDIGSVGDEIQIASTTAGATNQTEGRFIITKNSATSYVVSTTSGGAEAALTNTHTAGAHIVNVQRNVVWKPTDTTKGFVLDNISTVAGFNLQWARFEYPGAAIRLETSTSNVAAIDYCVAYQPRATAFNWTVSKTTSTHTGLVVIGGTVGTGAGISLTSNANNKNFTDTYIFGMKRNAVSITSFNNTFTRLVVAGCNIDNILTTGAVLFSTAGSISFIDSDIYANRNAAFMVTGTTDSNITNSRVGSLASNVNVAVVSADTYNTLLVSGCSLGSDTIASGYLGLIPGSHIDFENTGGTIYNNISYTENGAAIATGAGLADTTVRSGTTGEHSVRLAPETMTGRSLKFDVVATPGEATLVTGYIWENATFVADGSASVIAQMWLPGKTPGVDTPDAQQTMTKTASSSSSSALFTLSASYPGSTYDVATVWVTAITTTAGAYAYVGSINQGGSPATKFNIWRDGRPIDFMPEAIGDSQAIAAAVWNYLTANTTTAGTTGKQLKDGLTTGKYIALA